MIIAREKQNITAESRHSGLAQIKRRIKTNSFEIIAISKVQYLSVDVLWRSTVVVVGQDYYALFTKVFRAGWSASTMGCIVLRSTLRLRYVISTYYEYHHCLRKPAYNTYINRCSGDRIKRSVIAEFGFIIINF